MIELERMKPNAIERAMVDVMRYSNQCVLVLDEETLSTMIDCVMVVNKHMPLLRNIKTIQLLEELRHIWNTKYGNPKEE